MSPPSGPSPIPRRSFLFGAALAVGAFATACGDDGDGSSAASTSTTAPTTAAATATTPTLASFVASGPRGPARVALTFHTNGEIALADQLLTVLEQRRVRMTSFVVGDWLEANTDMARRIAAGGHEFANHTFTHPAFAQLSRDDMLDQVLRCRDVLTRLTGGPGVAFRPSGTDDGTTSPGEQVLSVAADAGYSTVLGFDVDPFDYDDPGPGAVTQRTLAAVQPGSIISLHFGHPGTITALPAILDGLDARELAPVTVSRLLR